MINHATSAVLAINNPSPINAIPTTRSFGSESSSFFNICNDSNPSNKSIKNNKKNLNYKKII